jgi:hypothetical protein
VIRGIFSKKADSPTEADAPRAVEQVTETPAEAGDAIEASGTALAKWPWDGQPDFTACNFALRHLFSNLPARLKVDGTVHAETCLAASGAIAGFAAQRALFARISQGDEPGLMQQMRAVTTTIGAKYFIGTPLNLALLPTSNAEANQKLWSLAAAGAIVAGLDRSKLPKLEDMFAHVSKAIGGDLEGFPSVEKKHYPQKRADELLKQVWPLATMCFSGRFPGIPQEFGAASTRFWPAIGAHVASALIRKLQPVVDPGIGLQIVMETAIYASKLDPVVVKDISQVAGNA